MLRCSPQQRIQSRTISRICNHEAYSERLFSPWLRERLERRASYATELMEVYVLDKQKGPSVREAFEAAQAFFEGALQEFETKSKTAGANEAPRDPHMYRGPLYEEDIRRANTRADSSPLQRSYTSYDESCQEDSYYGDFISSPSSRPHRNYDRTNSPPSRGDYDAFTSSQSGPSRAHTEPMHSRDSSRPRSYCPHTLPRASPPPQDPSPNANPPYICLYVVLSVPGSASADEIKRAYRKLSLKCHPDRHVTKLESVRWRAKVRMTDLSLSKEILCDAPKREYYNKTGRVPGIYSM
jgi:hypothetical protein